MKTAFSRRLLAILLVAAMCLSVMPAMVFAEEIPTWDAGKQGYTNQQAIESATIAEGITVTFDKGTNSNAPKYYTSGTAIRCYGGNSFTVTSTKGNITGIVLGFGGSDGTNEITADSGAYADGTWTGDAGSVTFTIGGTKGNRRIQTITVTVADGGGTTEPTCTHENATFEDTYTNCLEEGVRTYTCPDCGDTWTETISAKGQHTDADNDKVCDDCGVSLGGETGGETTSTFVKVTTAPADWSGTYLIVYETDSLIFDGSLEILDAVENTQSVTISGDQITADLKYSFSIEPCGTNYAIKSASGWYIYRTGDSNGLNSRQNEPYKVSIGFAQDGDLEITSSSAHLRYNSASNQLRFRFYKSASYANQQAISLYKLVESAPVEPIEPTVDGAVLNAVSATLEGDIGLNYYVTLPSSVRDAEGAEVRFTVNGAVKPSVPVSSGTLVTEGTYKGTYKFTYRMNAKEMHDQVTFAVYNGTSEVELYSTASAKQGTSFAYTLAEYFQKLIEKNSGDEKLVALANATLTYGTYAQRAFHYNDEALGDLSDFTDVTAETLAQYQMTKTAELPEGLTLSEMTLILETETKICLYFNATDIASYNFTLDGTAVTPKEVTGKGYCIEIPNVSAKDLDKTHTLAINGSCELSFSALSYAYAAVADTKTDVDVCKAVKALYKYNQAANAYFG